MIEPILNAHLLQDHGIRPTPNRILVLNTLQEATHPMTLSELEERIGSIDKSGIFRTLVSFRDHKLVHVLEVCDEGTQYELCHSSHEDGDNDSHVHFHCTVCHRTFCLEDSPVLPPALPEGFVADYVSCVVKGVCPDCKRKL